MNGTLLHILFCYRHRENMYKPVEAAEERTTHNNGTERMEWHQTHGNQCPLSPIKGATNLLWYKHNTSNIFSIWLDLQCAKFNRMSKWQVGHMRLTRRPIFPLECQAFNATGETVTSISAVLWCIKLSASLRVTSYLRGPWWPKAMTGLMFSKGFAMLP